jgi:hypothetical protein
VEGAAWPELDHPVIVICCNGPLGLHCCRLRKSSPKYLARGRALLTENLVNSLSNPLHHPSKVSWNLP